MNKRRIGAILSYILLAIKTIVGLIFTPILVRVLGQSEYGLYSLVSSVITYITVLDFGLGNAITVFTTKFKTNNQKEEEFNLNGIAIIIYSIIGIIAFIVGIVLYNNIQNMFGNTMTSQEIELAKIMTLILTFNVSITFPFTVFSSIITAYEEFVFAKLVNIIRTIMSPILMLIVLAFGYRSVALAVVTTIVNILCLLLNMFFCSKKLKIKIKFNFTKQHIILIKQIFSYSVFIFLGVVMDKLNWSVDQFILGSIVGTTAVAIYSAASQLSTMYQSFSTGISGVMLPKVTAMVEKKVPDEQISDLFIRTGRVQYIVMALVITGFIIFGPEFINLWVGQEYYQAYYIACILMIPVTIPLIQNVGISILQAKNKHKFRTIVYLIIAIGNVGISIPLAKMYGGVGAAVGTAISVLIGSIIIMNIYYYKVININIPKFWKEIIKMTAPVLLTLIIGLVMNKMFVANSYLKLGLKILVYTTIYALFMWKMGMSSYEKNIVNNQIKKLKKIISNKKI